MFEMLPIHRAAASGDLQELQKRIIAKERIESEEFKGLSLNSTGAVSPEGHFTMLTPKEVMICIAPDERHQACVITSFGLVFTQQTG